MKPLHRCLKASLTTILLSIVFTSVELPREQHTLPGSNTRENSRCHTLTRSSPRLMLYLTFDLNTLHDTWFSSGTIHERPRGVFLFSFFFSLTRNRDSSARITITPIRLERRTAINAGSTYTEPFYARLWRRMSAPAYIFCVISCIQ